jgi:hypothetical protein
MPNAGVNTTRQAVRLGMAAYFGGSYVERDRSWQGGPLMAYGLGTVKAYLGKGIADSDYTAGMVEGRGMGTVAAIQLRASHRARRSSGGKIPVAAATGFKVEAFGVVLHLFHLSEQAYVEDAEADLEALIEQIIDQIEADRQLGGCVVQAGEGDAGIDSVMDIPEVSGDRGRAGTLAQVSFDVLIVVQA